MGRTLYRLIGAMAVAAGATAIDRPRTLDNRGTRPDGPRVFDASPPVVRVLVPPGKRALTIEIHDPHGLATRLRPGDRVDVRLFPFVPPAEGPRFEVVKEGARVLATAWVMRPDVEGRPATVAYATLEGTRADSARLANAAVRGSIQLAQSLGLSSVAH